MCHTDGKWSHLGECRATTTVTTTTATTTTTPTVESKELEMKAFGHSTALSSGYAAAKAIDNNCRTYWQSCQGERCVTNQWIAFGQRLGKEVTVDTFEIYPIPHNQAPLKCDLEHVTNAPHPLRFFGQPENTGGGAPTPVEGGSAHPISILIVWVASYLCHFMLTRGCTFR